MLFKDTINDVTTISYWTCDRIHTAPLAAIEAAHEAANEEEVKPGPHPFHSITTEVDPVKWASVGHTALDHLTDAIDAWAEWVDEAVAEAEARGDDSTEHAREFTGYVFRDEMPVEVRTLHDLVTTALEVVQ